MNNRCYRIIFNAARGLLMVVAEIAGSGRAGRAAGRGSVVGRSAAGRRRRLSPLATGLLLALGAIQPLQAAIVADSSAPGNQQPVVVSTANGLPQVNIQTPNADGVSRNQYQQFDIGANGAILNNGASNSHTELAGMVAANPLLAQGAAQVILNEVNSRTPAQLNGTLEVAGQRAEVVIASPAGIQCSSCGFINASGTTLVAGQAVFSQGQLQGYVVQDGLIQINGAGLNASQSDYTRLIARAVKVNAKLIAGTALQVTTGRNRTDRQGQVMASESGAGGDNAPQFALDVAAMGGMYAGKIRLTGTDAGVGVHNAGEIGATAGELALNVNGDLVNTRVLSAAGDSQLQLAALDNRGTVQAGGMLHGQLRGALSNQGTLQAEGDLQLAASEVDNRGRVQAGQGLQLHSDGRLSNQQQLLAGADMALSAASIENHASGVLAAGVDSQGNLRQRGNLQLDSRGAVRLARQQLAHDSLQVKAASLDMQGSQSAAGRLALQSKSDLNLRAATLTADGQLSLHSGGSLITEQGTVTGETLSLQAERLANQGGRLQQTGQADLDLAFDAGIDNRQGLIASNGAGWRLTANQIDNRGGQLSHAGQGRLQLTTERFLGAGGSLISNGQLQFDGGDYDFSASQIRATDIDAKVRNLELQQARVTQWGQGQLQLTVAGTLGNRAGTLVGRQLKLQAAQIENSDGEITATDGLQLTATQQLDNQQGRLISGGDLQLTTPRLNNQAGVLSAGRQAQLTVNDTLNRQGQLLAGQWLQLAGQRLSGDEQLLSDGDLTLDLQNDFRNDQRLQAAGNLTVHSLGALSNQGTMQAGGRLSLDSESLENGAAAELSGHQTLVKVSGLLSNQGLIDGGQTWLAAETLDNGGLGRIYGDQLAIAAKRLSNHADAAGLHAGVIAGREQLDIGAEQIENLDQGLLYSGGDLAIGGELDSQHRAKGQAKRLLNRGATVESQGAMTLNIADIQNLNAGLQTQVVEVSRTRVHQVALRGDPTRYDWADIVKTEYDKYGVPTVTLRNGQHSDEYYEYDYERVIQQTQVTASHPGQIQSGGAMTITAEQLSNQDSRLVAGGALTAAVGRLDNSATAGVEIITDRGKVTYHYPKKTKHAFGPTKTSPGADTSDYVPTAVENSLDLGVQRYQANSGEGIAGQSLPSGSAPVQIDVPAASGGDGSAVPVVIRTETGTPTLPTSSLYQLKPGNAAPYLVETDPRFTNNRQWLGSDYMQRALLSDPALMQKRLGDGYYEQQLVREQVIRLTGQRYLGQYQSDEAQYQALMDNGIAFARTCHLTPGVALTAAQMALLTQDMVWLVSKTVTLADGRTEQVLVPQVYARVQSGDLNGEGALLAGASQQWQVRNQLTNQGHLLSKTTLGVSAGEVLNQGTLQAAKVQVQARDDLRNIGGTITGKQQVQLSAGRDLENRSTLQGQGDNLGLDRIAGIYVTGDNGTLSLSAGRDIQLTASQVAASGKDSLLSLQAGRDIALNTLTTTHHERADFGGDNFRELSQRREQGSELSGGTIQAQAGRDITARAAAIMADNAVSLSAQRDLQLQAGEQQDNLVEHSRQGSSGLFAKMSIAKQDSLAQTQAIGSQVTGSQLSLQAGRDVQVTGSSVAGEQAVVIGAGRDVTITAAREQRTESHYQQEKRTGVMSSGGVGTGYGMSEQRTQEQTHADLGRESTIGSSQGSVQITAGRDLTVQGSDIIAQQNVALSGEQVTIAASEAQQDAHQRREWQQSGLSIGLSGRVGDAVNNAVNSLHAARDSSDSRLSALQSTKAALAGVQAAQALQLSNAQQANGQGGGDAIGISASIGHQSSVSDSQQQQRTARGSTVTAGQSVSIVARGDSQQPTARAGSNDITLSGSSIKAGGDVRLQASHDIQLQSAEEQSSERSRNQNQGSSLGVGVGIGKGGAGMTLNGSVSRGSGHENSDRLSHHESTIDAGHQVSLISGNDTRLQGAQVSGKGIQAEVGGNLTVRSEQDREDYQSRQQSSSIGATVPVSGAGGSISASQQRDRMDSHYQAVQEQTGLFAGTDGFDVKVGQHTQLDGGVIASTATPEKNTLDTGTLGFSNIENHADFSTQHQGMGISTGPLGGGGSLSGAGIGIASNLANGILSGGGHNGSARSETQAAVSAGSIRIRDNSAQQQDVNALSRDTANANPGLDPIFDKAREQQRLAESQLIGELGGQVMDVVRTQGAIAAEQAKQDPNALAKAEAALRQEQGGTAKLTPEAIRERAYQDAMQQYGTGSSLQRGVQAATAALQGLAGGDFSKAALDAASPYIAGLIHDATTETDRKGESHVNTEANLAAHALVNVAIALAEGGNGRDALARASGAVSGEAVAMMAKAYYDKPVSQLTEEEKQTISALATAAAGLAGGLTGDSSARATTAAQAGKNAAENNSLSDGFPMSKGMADYGQSVQSYAQQAYEKNLPPEQVQADLTEMVKGDLPESADIIKAILSNNPGSDTVMAVLSAQDAKDYALALLTTIPAEKALSLVGKAAKVIDNKILISAAEKISTAKPGKQSTVPRDLNEQLLWNQVKENPTIGKALDGMNNDPRFPVSAGFQKMEAKQKLSDGSTITVHYQYNSTTGKAYDMKITTPQRVQPDPQDVISNIKEQIR